MTTATAASASWARVLARSAKTALAVAIRWHGRCHPYYHYFSRRESRAKQVRWGKSFFVVARLGNSREQTSTVKWRNETQWLLSWANPQRERVIASSINQ